MIKEKIEKVNQEIDRLWGEKERIKFDLEISSIEDEFFNRDDKWINEICLLEESL